MRMSRQDIQKADDAYEAVAARNAGRIDSLDDVVSEIGSAFPVADVDMLKQRWYRELAAAADRRALEKADNGQLSLFDGNAEALEGFFALGDSQRVKVKVALNADWVANLQIKSENAGRIMQRYLEAQAEHSRLQPYLAQGMTTEVALRAYLQDHPQPQKVAVSATNGRP